MGAFLGTTRSGNYTGMFITGWSGDNGDPDNFVAPLWASYSMPVGDTSHFKDRRFDAEMKAAVLEVNTRQADGRLQEDPGADSRRRALGVRELDPAGAGDPQERRGLSS